MEQTKTKKALIMSVLSVFLCIAMLIGMTFAWFTDTASTGVNKIQAGTLDVDLEMATAWNEDGSVKTWESAVGKTLTFKTKDNRSAEQILWEPGCTYELPELRVVNNGNLALKYKIQITGIKGDAKLNEVIDWTISDASLDKDHSLAAGATSDALTIKGHMQESAGNEYQGKSIDGIAITVYATQLNSESDSYGSDYDKTAQYPDVNYKNATNTESLGKVLEELKNSDKPSYIELSGTNIEIDNSVAEKIGDDTTLAGKGVDNTTISMKKAKVISDNVTIKDATVKGNAPAGNGGALQIAGNNTTLDNVKFIGQGFNGDTKAISVTGSNAKIKNSKISNAFRGIIFWDNIGGDNLIEDCIIDNVIYTFNINASTVMPGTTLTVRRTTLNGWTSYSGCMSHVTFDNCQLGKSNGYAYLVAYADSTFNECTFNDGYKVAAGSAGKTLKFTKCKLADGTMITADNFGEKLGDVDDVLKGCTIIVNDTIVNL